MILRIPLKRVTSSFTVEYRQAKRRKTGSAKLGWAHAKPAPGGDDEKATRIAISTFKNRRRQTASGRRFAINSARPHSSEPY
jgi:hypothetical protein